MLNYQRVLLIELDDGNILTGKPKQFDGEKPWVSSYDFPNKTNPMNCKIDVSPKQTYPLVN